MHSAGKIIRLAFRNILCSAQLESATRFSTVPLLDDMDELMSEESTAHCAFRRKPACAESDVRADGESQCVDGSRRFGRPRSRVNTYLPEIVDEARLHEFTDGSVEGLAGRAQNLVNNRRHTRRFRAGSPSALQALFLPALLAFLSANVMRAARAFPSKDEASQRRDLRNDLRHLPIH